MVANFVITDIWPDTHFCIHSFHEFYQYIQLYANNLGGPIVIYFCRWFCLQITPATNTTAKTDKSFTLLTCTSVSGSSWCREMQERTLHGRRNSCMPRLQTRHHTPSCHPPVSHPHLKTQPPHITPNISWQHTESAGVVFLTAHGHNASQCWRRLNS